MKHTTVNTRSFNFFLNLSEILGIVPITNKKVNYVYVTILLLITLGLFYAAFRERGELYSISKTSFIIPDVLAILGNVVFNTSIFFSATFNRNAWKDLQDIFVKSSTKQQSSIIGILKCVFCLCVYFTLHIWDLTIMNEYEIYKVLQFNKFFMYLDFYQLITCFNMYFILIEIKSNYQNLLNNYTNEFIKMNSEELLLHKVAEIQRKIEENEMAIEMFNMYFGWPLLILFATCLIYIIIYLNFAFGYNDIMKIYGKTDSFSFVFLYLCTIYYLVSIFCFQNLKTNQSDSELIIHTTSILSVFIDTDGNGSEGVRSNF